ncbi:MAG: PocR ligand-binding domain-containing protein, partial [Victivallales bacterium]
MENRLIQEKAIRIFEEQFHCRLCCHDYSGQLQGVPLPQYHLNPFCTGLKEHKNKLTELCIEFDRDKVQHQLLRTHPRPFFKCCHCGMREAVFPIVADGKLHG